MPRKLKHEDHLDDLRPWSWIWIESESQFQVGMYERITPAQAKAQIGTCPAEEAKGYRYLGPNRKV